MKKEKRKAVTWKDVHFQSGNVIAGCQSLLKAINLLEEQATLPEEKADNHAFMVRLSECCKRHECLAIKTLPTAKEKVAEGDMMLYYNVYGGLCEIMREIEALSNELSSKMK